MMSKKVYYTAESLEQAKKELERLQTTERRKVAEQLGEAIKQGDISDSAEFRAAQEAYGMLEMRISELQDKVAHARVIDKSRIDTSRVSVLTRVTFRDQGSGKVSTHTLVPPAEADAKQGKLSINSLVAKGLLNRRKGDVVVVKVPSGERRLEILDISLA